MMLIEKRRKSLIKKTLLPIWILLVVLLALPSACKSPPKFEVVSIGVTPPEVAAGNIVSIKADVRNTGGSQGVYTVILTVDGAEVESKDITVAPGATETATFSLFKDKAGTYKIAIEKLGTSLTIKPKLVAKEVELKYDDGNADNHFSSVAGGYLVDFMPPAVPFTIKKIRLYGAIRGSAVQDTFDVEIWDKDRKVLYKKVHPATKFPISLAMPGQQVKEAAWVGIEMPNIDVSDRFYVHVWKGPIMIQGIHLGVDDSIKNEHSTITVSTTGTTKEVESWKSDYLCNCWSGDKSKTNWMIRVVGTATIPE